MASLAAIYKQVAREGARWGLVPVLRDGCVKVCELVAEVSPRPQGCTTIPHKEPRVICSLNEESGLDGWSSVLLHRLKREHHDFMKLVRNRQARLKATQQAELDLRRKDLRQKLQNLAVQRVLSTGIMR